MMIKVNVKIAATLALVICVGMSGFWLMILSLADELDPIRGVASFANSISMALAFAVAVTAAVYMMVSNRKKKSRSGRRHHRSHRHGKHEDHTDSASP